MRPGWSNIEQDTISAIVALGPGLQPLGSLLSRLTREVREMLNGGLTRKENSLCAVLDLSFKNGLQLTSGVERAIANPFAARGIVPSGFTPWYAEDASGSPLALDGWMLNKTPKDGGGKIMPGFFGLTINFDLQHTRPFLAAYKSADQSITSGTNNAVTWDSIREQDPVPTTAPLINNGIIYIDASVSSRIKVTEPGLYDFSAMLGIGAAAAGIGRYWFAKNGTITGPEKRFGFTQMLNSAAAGVPLNLATTLGMTTSDYVEVYALQSSGGALNVFGAPTGDTDSMLEVKRRRSRATPSGRVVGVLEFG